MKPPAMTEREFLDTIVTEAKATGWLVFHPLPAQKQSGRWVTATQGHVGYPDLTLVHPTRGQLIFAELKSEKGTLGEGQPEWLAALHLAGVRAEVWRPSDMPRIIGALYGRQVVG